MDQLGMFAKYWRPGAVKTRLAATIGDQAASRLCRVFIRTLAARCGQTADRRWLCYWPLDARTSFEEFTPSWRLVPQADGDLGARMHDYFERSFAAGAGKVVLIGVDSPNLPTALIQRAFRELDERPVVLGPCSDGGYYLIGAAESTPPVFDDVQWSSAEVWGQTVEKLNRAQLPYARLSPWFDVDQWPDLLRLADELREEHDGSLAELRTAVMAVVADRRSRAGGEGEDEQCPIA